MAEPTLSGPSVPDPVGVLGSGHRVWLNGPRRGVGEEGGAVEIARTQLAAPTTPGGDRSGTHR
jgi:hypothetical protein